MTTPIAKTAMHLTFATAIVGAAIATGISAARAAPLAVSATSNSSSTLIQTIGYGTTVWKNDGQPYFFENCWWQKQRQYKGKKPTRNVRNKKVSCTDLASPTAGWKDTGKPYFFENCWWQKQLLYKAGRQTGRSRNRKVSCPDVKQ